MWSMNEINSYSAIYKGLIKKGFSGGEGADPTGRVCEIYVAIQLFKHRMKKASSRKDYSDKLILYISQLGTN